MQRGWEALKALGWSLQRPRPRNPRAATPKPRRLLKKVGQAVDEEDAREPRLPVVVYASDEHRLGLKRSRAGSGRRRESGRWRWAITASSGCTSPPSWRRKPARRLWYSPTACPNCSSSGFWLSLPARSERVRAAG